MTGNPERDTNGCYICQPGNPAAAEEGCSACDQTAFDWTRAVYDARNRQRKKVDTEPEDEDSEREPWWRL